MEYNLTDTWTQGECTAMPVFQSIKDTVKATGLSEFFLRKGIRQGSLPHIKSGAKAYINVPAMIKQLEDESLKNIREYE